MGSLILVPLADLRPPLGAPGAASEQSSGTQTRGWSKGSLLLGPLVSLGKSFSR